MLLPRALIALLALPGVVAYLVPLLLAPEESPLVPWRSSAILPGMAGSALLVWCTREFFVAGKGTLAPWSPPRHLVTTGPYRRSRNPMYVAVATVLFGWALWFWSAALLVYALGVILAFHLRILLYEEPRLASSFGEEWVRYRARVRRWL